ncbi:MAG: dihydrofolate reductase family protein [Armatimonas sp.]
MGSSTYEWMLQHLDDSGWPYIQPTWVFTTRSLPILPSANIQFVQGDVAPVHAAMKEAAQDKNIWLVGGGELVGQFYDAGLLDEIIVQITSVVLGSGKPLLPRQIAFPPLIRTSVQTYGTGFVEIRYAVGASTS